MSVTNHEHPNKKAESLKQLISRTSEKPLLYAVMAFQAVCMLLLAFKDGAAEPYCLIMAAVLPLSTYIALRIVSGLAYGDRALFILTALLCSLGIITLKAVMATSDKARDQSVFLGYGYLFMFIGLAVPLLFRGREKLIRIGAVLSIGFMLMPFAFHTGSSARNWVKLGEGFRFQPSELIKPVAAAILASEFTRGKKFRDWAFGALYGAAACVILIVQKDLGAAILYFMLTVAMFTAGTGRWRLTLIALCAAAALCAVFIKLAPDVKYFSYVQDRLDLFNHPWTTKSDNANQIRQGLISVASGGWIGSGLGLGSARRVAVVWSDYIFAAVCEEFGMLFALCLIAVYGVIFLRSAAAALAARCRFHALLAFGCGFEITSQMLLIVCGNLHILPLTGVTLPFVSDGGSSLVASMLMMGMILGVSGLNAREEYDDYRGITGEDDR